MHDIMYEYLSQSVSYVVQGNSQDSYVRQMGCILHGLCEENSVLCTHYCMYADIDISELPAVMILYCKKLTGQV